MIVHPAKHFFEAKLPELEDGEEEIFFRHPKWPLKVNQIGIIFFDNEDEVIYGPDNNFRIRNRGKEKHSAYYGIGPKPRVCYECYHNVLCEGKHTYFIDGNPLNCSIENIMLAGAPPAKWLDPEGYALYVKVIRANKIFAQNTLDYMETMDQRTIRKGGDPDHYWQLFGELPNWLQSKIKHRKKKLAEG